MEISLMASRFGVDTRMLATTPHSRPATTSSSRRTLVAPYAKASARASSLRSNCVAPFGGGSGTDDFLGRRNPPASPFSTSRGKRSVVTMVIPFRRGAAFEQPPPDLSSYLFHNRIVYLGLPLVPAVSELILAEFLYLQYDNPDKPVYMYINSTGTTRGDRKLGYEAEAFVIYDSMRYSKLPIFTLCIGNAWGEAALLLAAGAAGNRSALPSARIMMKQPIGRFQGQATDVQLARKEMNRVKADLVALFAKHTGQPEERVNEDMSNNKYFSPDEAIEYGIIDKILYTEKGKRDGGVVSELKKANFIT